jgi:hypothetical protein
MQQIEEEVDTNAARDVLIDQGNMSQGRRGDLQRQSELER